MIALVLGGADTLHDDLRAAYELTLPRTAVAWNLVIAVNRAGIEIPPIDHWASLHPECFHRDRGGPGWFEQRYDRMSPAVHGFAAWGPSSKPTNSVRPLDCTEDGSSGYFGVEVAQHLGADRIVLCGIPMTPTPHFDSDEPWEMANAHWKHWLREHEKGKLQGVRSMSGRTRDLLGAPTTEWLRGSAVTTG